MKFKLWMEQSQVLQTLMGLRPQMAMAAQQIYDAWKQDENDEYNGGGICQDIAESISDVIGKHLTGNFDVGTVNAACGEQHVWVMMAIGNEGFEIDVPYHIYETGGGYTWKKIPDVKFTPEDIIISPTNSDDVRNTLENPY